MNGIDNPILFYPSACIMVLMAILAISFRNIFHSLLAAIAVFFLAGLFFYILGSEYNAVIQIAIYGVAVPVILGLAIMFTNVNKNNDNSANNLNSKYIVFLCVGIFVLAFIYLMKTSLLIVPDSLIISEPTINPLGTLKAFGNGIFVKYVWAFELVSLILTIIIVGLTLFKEEKCRK